MPSKPLAAEIDTANRFAVSAMGDTIAILLLRRLAGTITKADALNLAAWLVALADDDDKFGELLEAVRNT